MPLRHRTGDAARTFSSQRLVEGAGLRRWPAVLPCALHFPFLLVSALHWLRLQLFAASSCAEDAACFSALLFHSSYFCFLEAACSLSPGEGAAARGTRLRGPSSAALTRWANTLTFDPHKDGRHFKGCSGGGASVSSSQLTKKC